MGGGLGLDSGGGVGRRWRGVFDIAPSFFFNLYPFVTFFFICSTDDLLASFSIIRVSKRKSSSYVTLRNKLELFRIFPPGINKMKRF